MLLDPHEAMLLEAAVCSQPKNLPGSRLGGVERALPTGHALANDLGVLIDPYLELVLDQIMRLCPSHGGSP